eukprot:6177256-Pleurochrysis_carterae.AAC.3
MHQLDCLQQRLPHASDRVWPTTTRALKATRSPGNAKYDADNPRLAQPCAVAVAVAQLPNQTRMPHWRPAPDGYAVQISVAYSISIKMEDISRGSVL